MINFNKGISTPIALIFILILALISIAMVLGYQFYYPMSLEENGIPIIGIQKNETADSKISEEEFYSYL